jgi:hypothetical protein
VGTPIQNGAAAMGAKSTAPAATSSKVDLAALFAAVKAQGGGVATGGAVYTKQEADAEAQAVYQQMLGRNATGNDYSKAISLLMSQSSDTSAAGRQQALSSAIMNSPEYKIKQDNKYLEAIYQSVANSVRNAQA